MTRLAVRVQAFANWGCLVQGSAQGRVSTEQKRSLQNGRNSWSSGCVLFSVNVRKIVRLADLFALRCNDRRAD